ncbi:MAG: hemerythrin domain-containing protein [Thermoplasmata archaeon]
MTAEVDILTPIHKAIRAMIYDLGDQLQTTDFTDLAQTEAVVRQLKHEFTAAITSNCILCLVHHHGLGEEMQAFPELAKFDGPLIDRLLKEHRQFEMRLSALSKIGTQLESLSEPAARIRMGIRLNRGANEFFAAYFAHMNEEEEKLLPLLLEHFTDEQIIAFSTHIEESMPPERFQEYMRWLLPSLNANELTEMFRGIKMEPDPEVLGAFTSLAENHVDPARWRIVKSRVGM